MRKILLFIIFLFVIVSSGAAQIPLEQLEYAPDSTYVIGADEEGMALWKNRSIYDQKLLPYVVMGDTVGIILSEIMDTVEFVAGEFIVNSGNGQCVSDCCKEIIFTVNESSVYVINGNAPNFQNFISFDNSSGAIDIEFDFDLTERLYYLTNIYRGSTPLSYSEAKNLSLIGFNTLSIAADGFNPKIFGTFKLTICPYMSTETLVFSFDNDDDDNGGGGNGDGDDF